jgi:hypothetical protein
MHLENWFRCRKYIGEIIERIPPPKGNVDEPLQALILIPITILVELKLFSVL